MQIMFDPKASVIDYQDQGKQFPFPDLTHTLCPHCRKHRLKKHGFYDRYYISKAFTGHILIRRHICPGCRRTISSLPFFCHPRRAYSTEFILKVLTCFYSKKSTLAACLDTFFNNYGIPCGRQLLYRYRKRFCDNLNFLAMELLHIRKLKDFTFDHAHEKRARQVLSMVHHTAWTPLDVSIRLFLRSGHSYLTQLHFRV